MITGRVTAQRDAMVRLVVLDRVHKPHDVDAVIDTGFNGFLTLPRTMVQTLQLPLAGNRRVTLGDGSTVVLDLYLLLQYCGTRNHARCWCWQRKAAR